MAAHLRLTSQDFPWDQVVVVAPLQAVLPGVAMRVSVMVVRLIMPGGMASQTPVAEAVVAVRIRLGVWLWAEVMGVADSLLFDTPELQSRRRPWID